MFFRDPMMNALAIGAGTFYLTGNQTYGLMAGVASTMMR